MLAATFGTLSAHVTPRMKLKFSKPTIENFAFQLHYKATVTILLVFVILVCAREFFGSHIQCIADSGVPPNVIQTYCFFMATFTIVRHYNESLLQAGVLPHPGVGPMLESDEELHHKYYQWVPFVLLIQSICFYMPHYIWKKKEGGRIKALVDGLHVAGLALHNKDMVINGVNVPSKDTLERKLETIRKDIILRLRITRTWSTWLVSMEVVNLLHVMLQIYIINQFLNGQFINLGSQVINGKWNEINDPLETVFPKVTKCIFHKYGPSGSIQQHDALCVMALNIIHEKIYVALWFWLLFVFIVSIIAVIWRAASFFLYRRSLRFNELMFRKVNTVGKFNAYNVISVVNGCQFGDWLFLYYLAKNMQGFVFQQLFTKLAEELEKRELPLPHEGHVEKGAEPILIGRVDYDDETLPLKSDKKAE